MTNSKGQLEVEDLPEQVPDNWWQTLFDEWYLKTDGDVVENDEITTTEIALFCKVGHLTKDMAILDLCCGQGRHSLKLAEQGYTNVTGYDYSQFLIDTAKARLADARKASSSHPNVNFVQGDARKLPFDDHAFDAVLCLGNSFGYFANGGDDHKVLKEVARVLRPGGVFLLDLTDGAYVAKNYTPYTWEWIGEDLFVCRQRTVKNDMLCSREMITSTKQGVLRDQFYQERLYTEPEIIAALEECGLRAPKLQRSLQVTTVGDATGFDNTHHADPGMMEKRLLFKSYGSLALDTLHYPFDEMAVVMGDTSKSSWDKLNQSWQPEDFETREKLRAALDRIPHVKVTYFERHDTLYEDLKRTRPRFVLNLCDEGLNNRAELELHVPAILEALNIPYSGATPKGLALCYDKALVRAVAMSIGVPVPSEIVYTPGDDMDELATLLRLHNMSFPVFVKPQLGDGSIGITVDSLCNSHSQLVAQLERLTRQFPHKQFLIQEYLSGGEFSTGLLSTAGLRREDEESSAPTDDGVDKTWRVLPPIQVDYSKLSAGLPHIMGYESKWMPDSPYWTQLAYSVPEMDDQMKRVCEYAKLLANRLETRDYVRIDWRADANGVIKLLEVNPNPGWCWDGHLAIMAAKAGMTYSDMLGHIVMASQSRVVGAV